jgi:DNA-binding HxlR family transcriptional regulator
MNASDKKFLAIMPRLSSGRVEMLLEDVIGCRWTFSVLRAVAGGVLSDRLRQFRRAGIFERVQFPEIPPRVEYHLTPFGKKFLKLLKAVDRLQAELNGKDGE